ncbi:heavy metal-binding domain-containing protein [Enterococcus sp. LJL98]
MTQPSATSKTNAFDHILIATGNISRSYLVRELAFATEALTIDLFDQQNDPNTIFLGVSQQLKKQAAHYGADAVINCHFSYEQIKENGAITLQIFAYGTIVQFKHSMVGS